MPNTRKRGVWTKVGELCGKKGKWACKHYLNSFRRVLYPNDFTDVEKADVEKQIETWYVYSADEQTRAKNRAEIKA